MKIVRIGRHWGCVRIRILIFLSWYCRARFLLCPKLQGTSSPWKMLTGKAGTPQVFCCSRRRTDVQLLQLTYRTDFKPIVQGGSNLWDCLKASETILPKSLQLMSDESFPVSEILSGDFRGPGPLGPEKFLDFLGLCPELPQHELPFACVLLNNTERENPMPSPPDQWVTCLRNTFAALGFEHGNRWRSKGDAEKRFLSFLGWLRLIKVQKTQINFLPPTQNSPFRAPRKKVQVPRPLGKNAKKDPHKLYQGNFGVENWVPNRPFLPHNVSFFRWRSKGESKKNVGNCRGKPVPFPSNPILSEAPPGPSPFMSSEVQKRGKLVREVRSPKDKTNGRERDALSWHVLSRPLPGVPFWPSPRKYESVEIMGICCRAEPLLVFFSLWCSFFLIISLVFLFVFFFSSSLCFFLLFCFSLLVYDSSLVCLWSSDKKQNVTIHKIFPFYEVSYMYGRYHHARNQHKKGSENTGKECLSPSQGGMGPRPKEKGCVVFHTP